MVISCAADLWALADTVSAQIRNSDQVNVEALTKPQRMLIAGRVANIEQGATKTIRAAGISIAQAADAVDITRGAANYARMFLRRATAEEIELVVMGRLSIYHRAREIGRSASTLPPKSGLSEARTANYERVRRESSIWNQFKAALYALSSLPAVADVVRIVENKATTRAVVDSQLLPAHNWLAGFADKWTAPQRASASIDPRETAPTLEGFEWLGQAVAGEVTAEEVLTQFPNTSGECNRGGKSWVTQEKQAEYFMQSTVLNLVRTVANIRQPTIAEIPAEPAITPPPVTKGKPRNPRLSTQTKVAAAAAASVISSKRLEDLTVYRLKQLIAAQLQKEPCEGVAEMNLNSKTVNELLTSILNYN